MGDLFSNATPPVHAPRRGDVTLAFTPPPPMPTEDVDA